MKLYTQIEIPPAKEHLDHSQSVLLLGSCFADHMATHLQQAGFQVSHPFGALYNPISILQSVQRLQKEEYVTSEELFYAHSQWNHYDFHSQYSATQPTEALEQMNQAIHQGHAFLATRPWVLLTLGTAWTYVLQATQHVVANCHRQDASLFERRRLTQAEIEQALQNICDLFQGHTLLFTVSPIRHFKDGAHENQLSKSLLLLAVDAICRKNPHAHYFPAYEIVLDELRDYRFYNEDLLHPSSVAIQYVWERFNATYFTPLTQQACREREKISLMEHHRQTVPHSEASLLLEKEITERIRQWSEKYER